METFRIGLGIAALPSVCQCAFCVLGYKLHLSFYRAENGTRTRDPNLGKVVLYQLSYFRLYNFKK